MVRLRTPPPRTPRARAPVPGFLWVSVSTAGFATSVPGSRLSLQTHPQPTGSEEPQASSS